MGNENDGVRKQDASKMCKIYTSHCNQLRERKKAAGPAAQHRVWKVEMLFMVNAVTQSYRDKSKSALAACDDFTVY